MRMYYILQNVIMLFMIFFFQAEDGIRDLTVTGVQTCALPISGRTKMFFPGQSLYLGSKGAVEQFVRVLSWELANRDITVNAISPGPTETDMMQDRYRDKAAGISPFNRIAHPSEIADIAVFLAT